MKRENRDVNIADWATFQTLLFYQMEVIRRKRCSATDGVVNFKC